MTTFIIFIAIYTFTYSHYDGYRSYENEEPLMSASLSHKAGDTECGFC